LETFVFHELQRQACCHEEAVNFSHYRDKDQVEVDFVLESAGRLAGVEVKAGSTVTASDFKGFEKLRQAAPKRFAAGVVLYDGDAVLPFGPSLYAVPLSVLWATA
jgi:predicted AAA+ superfamily ATPase